MENEIIPNDYFGMAQDLRRMKRDFYKFKNHCNFRFILDIVETQFLNSICDFENYCLDQPFSFEVK